MDAAGDDQILDPALDRLATLGALLLFAELPAVTHAGGILRIGPAMLLVEHVPERIHGPLVAGRCDVEALARGELHARGAEVQFHPALMGVAHPEDVPLARLQPGKGHCLEGLHHLGLLCLARIVIRIEADDTGAVGPFVRIGVDQQTSALRVSAKHLRQRIAGLGQDAPRLVTHEIAATVIGEHRFGDEIVDGGCAAALAIAEELNQHRATLRSCPRSPYERQGALQAADRD